MLNLALDIIILNGLLLLIIPKEYLEAKTKHFLKSSHSHQAECGTHSEDGVTEEEIRISQYLGQYDSPPPKFH